MITKKQTKLIQILQNSSEPVSREVLAQEIDSSERTVQRYVDFINDEFKRKFSIVLERGHGYRLEGNLEDIARLTNQNMDVMGHDFRRNMLFLELAETSGITIDDLADKLGVSRSTLGKQLPGVKDDLQKYGLTLKSRSERGLYTEGSEEARRMAMLDRGFIWQSSIVTGTLLPEISEDDFDAVCDSVQEVLMSENIVIADMDISNLVTHIITVAARLRRGSYDQDTDISDLVKLHNLKTVKAVCEKAGNRLHVTFSKNDINWISKSSGFQIYQFNDAVIAVDDEIYQFTSQALKELSQISGIDYLSDQQKVMALAMHLRLLVNRLQNGVSSVNPMINRIRKDYSLTMDYAIFLARKIETTYGVHVGEDELGYLAIHLAGYSRKNSGRKKAALICQYGLGTSQLIRAKIAEETGDVDVVGVYPVRFVEIAAQQDVDYLISTVPIPGYHGSVPLIVETDILNGDAIHTIRKKMETGNTDNEFLSLFNKACWMKFHADNREQVLNRMFQNLKDTWHVSDHAILLIKEREEIFSTDIGRMTAIPHCIAPGDFQSVIEAAILDQPIHWDKEDVQLVLMICFNEKDADKSNVFRSMYTVVKNQSSVDALIHSQSYEEFMENLQEDLRG